MGFHRQLIAKQTRPKSEREIRAFAHMSFGIFFNEKQTEELFEQMKFSGSALKYLLFKVQDLAVELKSHFSHDKENNRNLQRQSLRCRKQMNLWGQIT